MAAKIKVHIQPRDYPSEDDFLITREFFEPLIRRAFTDRIEPECDGAAAFCVQFAMALDNHPSREDVLLERKRVKELIVDVLTSAIVEYLERRDGEKYRTVRK